MSTKAAAPIVADRLSSALTLPRRARPSIEGENFGIALSEARSVERRSETASARSEERAAPEPKETSESAPKRDDHNPIDKADAPVNDRADQPVDDQVANDPDAAVPPEKENGLANEAADPVDSETAEPSTAQEQGSATEVGAAQDGNTESTGAGQATQTVQAEAVASPDALLLKALEVGANAIQALRSETNGQPVQQQQSLANDNTQNQATTPALSNQAQFTTNADSGSGQNTGEQNADKTNQQSGGIRVEVPATQVNPETVSDSDETSNARLNNEAAAKLSERVETAPQASLQDIRATVLERGRAQSGDQTEDASQGTAQANRTSATGSNSNAQGELNLANALAKALVPEQSQQSSAAAQTLSFAGETEASSNTSSQTTGAGVPAPQEVRVTASAGAAPSVQAAFGVNATGDGGTIDQIVRVTQASTSQQTSHVRLQLDPPELGQLRIDVKVHQGNMNLHILADTEAAKSILESRMNELRNALQRGGIHVERFDIEVKNTQQSQTEGRHDKTSDGNDFGRQTNPQDQTREQSRGREGTGSGDDLPQAENAGNQELEETELGAVRQQPVLSGFDVTA